MFVSLSSLKFVMLVTFLTHRSNKTKKQIANGYNMSTELKLSGVKTFKRKYFKYL